MCGGALGGIGVGASGVEYNMYSRLDEGAKLQTIYLDKLYTNAVVSS